MTPLNEECGIIEWVDNLRTLRDIIVKHLRERRIAPNVSLPCPCWALDTWLGPLISISTQTVHRDQALPRRNLRRQNIFKIVSLQHKDSSQVWSCFPTIQNAIHTDLNRLPAVLHEWFIEMFPETESWFTARLRYTRSSAVMSMVGYVLGYVTLGPEGNPKNSNASDSEAIDFILLINLSQTDSAIGMVKICCLKKEQAVFFTSTSIVFSTR